MSMGTDLIITEAQSWPDRARAVSIETTTDYGFAADLLLGIKALQREVDATFDGIIAKAHAAHKEACGQKRKAEAPLLEAEAIVKRALCDYDTAREHERQQEERRLQELARQEAETRRLEEAAALERQGNATNDPELLYAAHVLMEQPLEAPVVLLERVTPKVSGLTYREQWKYRIVGPVDPAYTKPDDVKIGGVVRAMKGETKIAGVQVYCEKVAAAGGRSSG